MGSPRNETAPGSSTAWNGRAQPDRPGGPTASIAADLSPIKTTTRNDLRVQFTAAPTETPAMTELGPILVATDFSDHADQVVVRPNDWPLR
mgnify:CR=1 FL=1